MGGKFLEPTVLAVVSDLGGFEDILIESDNDEDNRERHDNQSKPRLQKVYKLGYECLGCLKDLKNFWRLDEENDDGTVARLL
ncbi:uncharacterized protein MELLADRAFT_87932 [Melampsora larici-populina 98AG31]|uniref:Timeless N-terminal domain-containing protein n=1 Tax=Melampsora larici-populina (strain 98AG31 / pathotype 3-4-7) TaxID=747676 RepID=F4SE10_MELLP|nr:uncharacterized protein MELLADRAFT_87932 [Melampsora larici-populina 98AG31]EGF97116.1 hypothetical protein MELLADRAFT_87932 [Melampsora larici-populina 98AG31]